MTFAQRRSCLTTHFSERIAVVKRRMTVLRQAVTWHCDRTPCNMWQTVHTFAHRSVIFWRSMWTRTSSLLSHRRQIRSPPQHELFLLSFYDTCFRQARYTHHVTFSHVQWCEVTTIGPVWISFNAHIKSCSIFLDKIILKLYLVTLAG